MSDDLFPDMGEQLSPRELWRRQFRREFAVTTELDDAAENMAWRAWSDLRSAADIATGQRPEVRAQTEIAAEETLATKLGAALWDEPLICGGCGRHEPCRHCADA